MRRGTSTLVSWQSLTDTPSFGSTLCCNSVGRRVGHLQLSEPASQQFWTSSEPSPSSSTIVSSFSVDHCRRPLRLVFTNSPLLSSFTYQRINPLWLQKLIKAFQSPPFSCLSKVPAIFHLHLVISAQHLIFISIYQSTMRDTGF